MRFHILDTSSSTMRPEPFAEVILNPTLLLPFGYCKAVLTVLKYKHVLEQTISMTNESFGLCIFFSILAPQLYHAYVWYKYFGCMFLVVLHFLFCSLINRYLQVYLYKCLTFFFRLIKFYRVNVICQALFWSPETEE